jgi:hypothetical protein
MQHRQCEYALGPDTESADRLKSLIDNCWDELDGQSEELAGRVRDDH